MRWSRGIPVFVLLAGAAALVAAWLWPGWPDGRGGASARLGHGDLLIGIDVTGTLETARSDSLGPPRLSGLWSFEISFLAPEGEEVEAGDPVLVFATAELERTRLEKISERDEVDKQIEKLVSDLELERRDVQLRLAEARSRLRLAGLKLERSGEMLAAREVEEVRLDHQLATREVAYQELRRDLLARRGAAARAALSERRDRAAARVVEIEAQVERMTVRAPSAGTVIYVADGKGEKKKVGDGVWRSEKVVEIPDLEKMLARGQVEEAEASRLEPGQPVTMRLDAYPDLEYRGRVGQVEPSVRRRSSAEPAKVFHFVIDLDETDRTRMRPGMRFAGRVQVERVSGVPLLPLEAVFPTTEGPRVWLASRTGWQPVTPRLGRRDDRHVEVLAGLQPGDRVSIVPRAVRGEGRR